MNFWDKIVRLFNADLSQDISTIWGLEEEQTDFISMATHQLKTPLSEIKWTINMLISEEVGKLNAEQKKWLSRAFDSNERVIRMVENMISAIRMESKTFELYPIHGSIEQVVEREVEEIIPLTKQKGIKFCYENRSQKPLFGFIDPDRLQSALQSILENAVHYTKPGGRVNLLLEKVGNKARITISDTGIGIPKSAHSQIFSRFFRAHNAFKVQSDGTGLGLFIARGIIEGHNGKIWFESNEGKGTVFFILLPLVNK